MSGIKLFGYKAPFEFLFKEVDSTGFYDVFKRESIPIITFILSFAPTKGYVDNVLNIAKDTDLTDAVYKYIGCLKDNVPQLDSDLIFIMEKIVRKIITKNKNSFDDKRSQLSSDFAKESNEGKDFIQTIIDDASNTDLSNLSTHHSPI